MGLGPWELSRADEGLQIPQGFLPAAKFSGAANVVMMPHHLLELVQVH